MKLRLWRLLKENKQSYGGPMDLVSKANVKENKSDVEAKEDEEGFLINSDDEAVAYYSNNRVNKFFKKLINGSFKNNFEKKQVSNAGGNQNVVSKV